MIRQRVELGKRVQHWLEAPLAVLGLVMLALIIVEFGFDLSPTWAGPVTRAQTTIWVIFIAAFVFEFALAPSKIRYLRRNWLTALAVVIPALRVFRIFNALRVVRAGSVFRGGGLIRVTTSLNRGSQALGRFFRTNRFGYLVVLATVVTLTAAAAVYFLEKSAPDANITSFGQAIWWAATVVTTVNAPLEPVTIEGRIVAFALRLFGLAVIGYITATIAVWLLGSTKTSPPHADTTNEDLRLQMDRIERLLNERPDDTSR